MAEFLATCTNEGCSNNGVPSILISEDGSVPSVVCGPCGDIPITNVVPR